MPSNRPNIDRLISAFLLEEPPDRVPHLEYWITSKAVYEYVLGKRYPSIESIPPCDIVKFAEKIGMDAVGVGLGWRPGEVFSESSLEVTHLNYVDGVIKDWPDLEKLGPEPDPDPVFQLLEEYLKAAKGTDIGVYFSLGSFFDATYLAMGMIDFLKKIYVDRAFVEKLMDIILDFHVRVARRVASEYSDELAFVFINDDICINDGFLVNPQIFRELFIPRMAKMVQPFKAKGMIMTFHTDGNVKDAIPMLKNLGFSAIHPVQPESNDIYELKGLYGDKICLMGNIHTPLLAYGSKTQIEQDVKTHIERLAPGGGYVLGSSTSIMDGIPPENFLTMIEACHKYGAYSRRME